MPQPLSKPPKKVKLGPKAIDLRPALAVHIARIAARWTLIENQQGVALALMLRSEVDGVMAMYGALSGAAPKTAILRGAAKHYLTDDEYTKFELLLRDTSGPQSERNDVVHAVWAVSNDHPDALLRVPSKDHLRWFAARVTKPSGFVLSPGDDTKAVIKILEQEFEKYDPRYWSWKEADFIAVDNRIEGLAKKWGDMLSLLSLKGQQRPRAPSP